MRVTLRPPADYPWYLKPFFRRQQHRYGQVLAPGLAWARVPRLFIAVAFLYGMLDLKRSQISPVLRSLVTVRVSQINSCEFCVDINSATLLERSHDIDKTRALANWRDSDLFDGRERAVLDYTEAITRTDARVSDAMIEELHRYYDDDAIVELTGLISFQNLSSKFNNALDIPEQGFCQLPGAD